MSRGFACQFRYVSFHRIIIFFLNISVAVVCGDDGCRRSGRAALIKHSVGAATAAAALVADDDNVAAKAYCTERALIVCMSVPATSKRRCCRGRETRDDGL